MSEAHHPAHERRILGTELLWAFGVGVLVAVLLGMIAVTQRTDPTATAMLRIRPTPMLRQSERRLPEPTSGHGILGIAHADGKELTGAAADSF